MTAVLAPRLVEAAAAPRRRWTRWAITLTGTVTTTWLLDASATAAGLAVAGSAVLDRVAPNLLVALLVVSYLAWAIGLAVNLRANVRLLDTTGVSTNALSKLAHDLAAHRSPATRRTVATCGYVLTEALKELPYVAGAVGAAAASSSVGGRDAVAFLVGANVAAMAYELVVAGGTRCYLRRRG